MYVKPQNMNITGPSHLSAGIVSPLCMPSFLPILICLIKRGFKSNLRLPHEQSHNNKMTLIIARLSLEKEKKGPRLSKVREWTLQEDNKIVIKGHLNPKLKTILFCFVGGR